MEPAVRNRSDSNQEDLKQTKTGQQTFADGPEGHAVFTEGLDSKSQRYDDLQPTDDPGDAVWSA